VIRKEKERRVTITGFEFVTGGNGVMVFDFGSWFLVL
jgi:hypothetical protein